MTPLPHSDLFDNKLTTLPRDAFAGLTTLKWLYVYSTCVVAKGVAAILLQYSSNPMPAALTLFYDHVQDSQRQSVVGASARRLCRAHEPFISESQTTLVALYAHRLLSCTAAAVLRHLHVLSMSTAIETHHFGCCPSFPRFLNENKLTTVANGTFRDLVELQVL